MDLQRESERERERQRQRLAETAAEMGEGARERLTEEAHGER